MDADFKARKYQNQDLREMFTHTQKLLQHFAVNIGGLHGALEDFPKMVFANVLRI